MRREWPLENAYASPGKFAEFAARHPREFGSLFANLDKILGLLREGQKVGGFRVNFFRSEREGVYRIGQTGVPSAKESRLYVFPNEQNWTMYILSIGTKDGQIHDVNEAVRIANHIKLPNTKV
jgi:hypothetical protein